MRGKGLWSAVCLLVFCGCGDEIERVEPVPIDQVPAPILKAAREKLPDVTFTTALKGKIRGKDAYELRGKTKTGKAREVEVSTTGDVIDVE
jgi:hypothetical protein